MKGLDLSKFRKVSADAKCTTMQSPDGHVIKINHAQLSPKMRGELAALPMQERHKSGKKEPVKMAQGGVVKYDYEGRPIPQDKKKEEKKDFTRGATASGYQPDTWKKNVKEGIQSLANGGEVQKPKYDINGNPIPQEPKQQTLGEKIGYPGSKPIKMAEGGEAPESEKITITLPSDRLPEIPADLINPEPGAEFAAKGPQAISPAAAASPGSLPYGVKPEDLGQAPAAGAPPVSNVAQESSVPNVAQAPQGLMAMGSGLNSEPTPQAPAPAPVDGLDKAVNMQQAGIQAEAKALGEQAQAKESALKEAQVEQRKNLDYLKAESQKVLGASQEAIQALKEHKIDPNRYFSSMGVGQRISTGIGLILGGLGGAATHQENPALKVLNAQIDRDIEAQKMELGQKENLVGALMRQFGNVKDASDMARIIQKEITATRLEEAAAKSGDPMAQARAQQAIGSLLRDVEPMKEKIALRRTVEGLMKEARDNPAKTQQALEAMRQIDPERAKDLESRYVPGVGFALTNDDAKGLKESKAAADTIKTGVKRLMEIGKVTGKSFSPEMRAEAEAIATGLKGPMRTALGLGTLSEGDMKLLDGIIRNPTSIFSLDSSNQKALQTLMKRTDENFAKMAEARGLKAPDPAAGLPPKQKSYVDWARKHPEDPRSKVILEKLGL